MLRESLRQQTVRWPLAVVRILLGHMWLRTSLHWLRADDRAVSLANQVGPLVESGRPASWYQPFLEGVVLPNAALFAGLVTLGEITAAVLLILGAATRVGAGVCMLLAANYTLLYNQSFLVPAGNAQYFWVGFLMLATAAGRAWGVDYWLHRRWPKIPLW